MKFDIPRTASSFPCFRHGKFHISPMFTTPDYYYCNDCEDELDEVERKENDGFHPKDTFVQRLKKVRISNNLSHAEMGKKLGGYDAWQVENWETGRVKPPYRPQLTHFLNVLDSLDI